MRVLKNPATIAAVILLALVVGACGKTGEQLGDLTQMDTGELQESGQKLSAAGAACSQAAGKISGLSQQLLADVKANDTDAIQATASELTAAADQLHKAASDGETAAQGLSSLPGDAGAQATQGTASAFKQCGALGDYADELATEVANADGSEDATKKLMKALENLGDKAAAAGQAAQI